MRDQLVDPCEIVLGGLGPVLEERPGVAIGAAGGIAAGLGQPLRELGAPALEEGEPVGGAEVAAERELQRERPLVVGGLVGEQLDEQLLAGGGDAVRLAQCADPAGGRRRTRAAARSPLSEPVATIPLTTVSGASAASMAPERSRRRSAGYSEPNEIPQSGPSVSERRFFSS